MNKYLSQGYDSTAMGGPEDDPTPSDMPLVAGGNPAWNDVLQHIPEDKRGEVVPKLQEWDKNFQDVQSKLAPWKEFIDRGVDPDTADLGVNVLNTIENNPQAAYEAIGKHLGISTQQAKEAVEDLQEDQKAAAQAGSGITSEQYESLKKQSDAMAQIIIANRQQEEITAEEQQLDQELTALKKEKGDFPEQEIIYRMMHGDMSAQDAYDDYVKFEEDLFKQRRQAPRVLSGGGMIPQPKVNVNELDRKGTKDHVAQLLINAQQQNQ